MCVVSLHFTGQNPVIRSQLTSEAGNVIHLYSPKEKEMNLVITQLFVFAIDKLEERGHRRK